MTNGCESRAMEYCLPSEPALGPDALEEVGLLHAELGQQVEVPRVEQAAGRVPGDA